MNLMKSAALAWPPAREGWLGHVHMHGVRLAWLRSNFPLTILRAESYTVAGPIRAGRAESPSTQSNFLIVRKGMPSMSEQENIETAKKQIAALNARNIDEYLSRVDESYVGESESPLSPIRGREGVRKSLEMLFAAFPDLRFEIEQILASGDFVVVRYNVTGTHKGNFAGIAATNKPVNFHSCSVVELRNGKAVRIRAYADNATLYQQLGVLSLPKAAAAG
jgi:steroid delta-isomerase-like uncharacterized protein